MSSTFLQAYASLSNPFFPCNIDGLRRSYSTTKIWLISDYLSGCFAVARGLLHLGLSPRWPLTPWGFPTRPARSYVSLSRYIVRMPVVDMLARVYHKFSSEVFTIFQRKHVVGVDSSLRQHNDVAYSLNSTTSIGTEQYLHIGKMLSFPTPSIYQPSKCFVTYGTMGHPDLKQLPVKGKPWSTLLAKDCIHEVRCNFSRQGRILFLFFK